MLQKTSRRVEVPSDGRLRCAVVSFSVCRIVTQQRRLLGALLFVVIVARGVRTAGREGWPAMAAALRTVPMFQADLGLFGYSLNWFPAGFRVQFHDVTAILMACALSIALLQRFVRAQKADARVDRSARDGGAGQPGQERIPGGHEPRNPHAAQRHHRDGGRAFRNVVQRRTKALPRGLATQRHGSAHAVNDILDLSKVESGNVELESLPMDLREVMARATEVVEARASAKALRLQRDVDGGVPVHLIGDPNRLRQVMVNLLGNALKFTEKGGLHVSVEPGPQDARAGCLRFAVADTGIGIPAEKLGAVFESFTQAESSTTRQYGGTGLGLSISRQLVELMGGRIWAESVVGGGAPSSSRSNCRCWRIKRKGRGRRRAQFRSMNWSVARVVYASCWPTTPRTTASWSCRIFEGRGRWWI